MNFENNPEKNQIPEELEEEKKNPFGLSDEELDNLYSGNDNSEMYKK